jgi:ABC-type transport system involved in multi-copper enzyme maturation permease subunit
VTTAELRSLPWPLWRQQLLALFRLELRKALLGKRALLVYGLAGLILLPTLLHLLFGRSDEHGASLPSFTQGLANFFEFLVLRFGVYLGSVWIFMNLFRGDLLDRTLHYYLLAPIRREVLVAGKYAAGVAAGWLVFGTVTLLAFVLGFLSWGPGTLARQAYLIPWYLAIVLLAVAGYGAVFTLAGMVFKNPLFPAVAIWAVEAANPFLPGFLKKISVIHYLNALRPVPINEGPFAIVADPPPVWLAVLGVLALAAALVWLAMLRARRLEIAYGGD